MLMIYRGATPWLLAARVESAQRSLKPLRALVHR